MPPVLAPVLNHMQRKNMIVYEARKICIHGAKHQKSCVLMPTKMLQQIRVRRVTQMAEQIEVNVSKELLTRNKVTGASNVSARLLVHHTLTRAPRACDAPGSELLEDIPRSIITCLMGTVLDKTCHYHYIPGDSRSCVVTQDAFELRAV